MNFDLYIYHYKVAGKDDDIKNTTKLIILFIHFLDFENQYIDINDLFKTNIYQTYTIKHILKNINNLRYML